MRFSSFLLNNLLRRKFRSLLTVFGVAVAIAAVVSLMGLSSGLRRSAADRYAGRGVDIVVQRLGVAQQNNSNLNQDIGEQIATLPGVKRVLPILQESVSFDDSSFIGVPMSGMLVENLPYSNLQITSGRLLQADDQHKVLLGKMLAQNLEKKVNDRLEIEGTEFEVVGIYESNNMYDQGSGIVPLADMQLLMDRPKQVTVFEVALADNLSDRNAAVKTIRAEIENLQDSSGKRIGLFAPPTQEFINENTEIKLTSAMAWITSAIALVIGSVGMLNTMVMSVLERTQEIGILRAIGWRKSRIVRMILGETFLLGILGALFGTVLAIAMTSTLSKISGFETYLRPDISLEVIGIGFFIAGVVAIIGGAYPAIRGAALPPTEALRYE